MADVAAQSYGVFSVRADGPAQGRRLCRRPGDYRPLPHDDLDDLTCTDDHDVALYWRSDYFDFLVVGSWPEQCQRSSRSGCSGHAGELLTSLMLSMLL